MLDPIVNFFTRIFQWIGRGIGLVVGVILWPFLWAGRWYTERGWVLKAVVGPDSPTYDYAAEVFEKMSTQPDFAEFLTLPLYEEIA